MMLSIRDDGHHVIDEPQAPRFSGRTAWARSVQTPLREFLRTETGGAAVLLAATVAALVWVNVDASSYDAVWSNDALDPLGDSGVALDLRDWVNSGLMTFFFFVVGLEARREFDLGELRERRRFALPFARRPRRHGRCAVAIYLAFNAGRPSAHGWGVAMSTDTAFALGLLALVGPRFPDRLRAFMLTVVVVDDIVALVVIAIVYSGSLRLGAAARRARASTPSSSSLHSARLRRRARLLRARRRRLGRRCSRRGVEPVVVGLAMGVLRVRVRRRRARRSSARRSGSASFASSRPPSSRARRPRSCERRRSPNERLQQLFHPWTSYVIVPLFALANAGIAIDGGFLRRGFTLADHARNPRSATSSASRSGSSAARGWSRV